MPHTDIICTLGPACSSPEGIQALLESGMNIARLNFSHGDHDSHKKLIAMVRSISLAKKVDIPLMLDTKGAEIRTGDTKDPYIVSVGEEVIFSPFQIEDDRQVIHVNYDDFMLDATETDRLLIDSGEIGFQILSIESDRVIARAHENGSISSRRHVSLPGADIDLPSITNRDWEDLTFGVEQELDLTALSFIRHADDVRSVQEFLSSHASDMRVIAKIETRAAVENLEEIITVADGVMVARGDLGADIALWDVPVVQDTIVALCNETDTPVIVATHMLESMIHHPVPTRAELTDIAHAVSSGADATMLSGETASGKYPAQAVYTMRKTIEATEAHLARIGKVKQPSRFE